MLLINVIFYRGYAPHQCDFLPRLCSSSSSIPLPGGRGPPVCIIRTKAPAKVLRKEINKSKKGEGITKMRPRLN